MTTPPTDPYSQAPSAPGLIPNAAPPVPPAPPAPYGQPGGAYPAAQYAGYSGYAPQPPRTLALWAIILSGLYTASTFALALLGPLTVEATTRQFENPSSTSVNFTAADLVNLLTFPIVVGSWVVLALWWGKIRQLRAAHGYQVGGIPAVEWWGWLVPLANLVLPFLGMRSLTKRLVGVGALLGWWLAYLASGVAGASSAVVLFGGIDFATGQLKDGANFDGLIPIYWATAVLLAISWAFLVYIIRATTDRAANTVASQ